MTLDPTEKPAYGQVWNWAGRPFMLICRGEGDGQWIVAFLYDNPPRANVHTDTAMAGLYDDPDRRITGYERVS